MTTSLSVINNSSWSRRFILSFDDLSNCILQIICSRIKQKNAINFTAIFQIGCLRWCRTALESRRYSSIAGLFSEPAHCSRKIVFLIDVNPWVEWSGVLLTLWLRSSSFRADGSSTVNDLVNDEYRHKLSCFRSTRSLFPLRTLSFELCSDFIGYRWSLRPYPRRYW